MSGDAVARGRALEEERKKVEKLEKQLEDRYAESLQWKEAAEQAIAQLKHTKLLVTAPKVSIRVADDVINLECSQLPLQRVREAVQNQILPKYVSIVGVCADLPQEKIVEQLHATVNELAASVTAKLQELLPSADVRDPKMPPKSRSSRQLSG